MGIEPTHARATIWCVNHFAIVAMIRVAGAVGIEPTPEVLETSVLPLNYAPLFKWWRGTDSNRRTQRERIYSPPRLATSLPLQEWCRLQDLNPQPTDYDSVALPIELSRHNTDQKMNRFILNISWWLGTESNRRHKDFQSFALPTELPSRMLFFNSLVDCSMPLPLPADSKMIDASRQLAANSIMLMLVSTD